MSEHDYEMKFLAAAVPELKEYLFSNDVYWDLGVQPPNGTHPYPQFSLGWLLVYRRRVGEEGLSDEERKVLDEIAEIESHWRSNWAKKVKIEFSMRLKLWTRFMNDLRDNPAANADRYLFEVRRRTMLELLRDASDEIPSIEFELLKALDTILKARLQPAGFIEDDSYAAQFPPDRFWFLYGLPRKQG